MRIFLDANILFSAAKSDGAVRKFVHLLLKGNHECWVDDYVVTEARRNLNAKEPGSLSVLDELLTRLHISSLQQLTDVTHKNIAWLPEKDRPVLAAALRLQCDVLVTGDKTHFGIGYGKVYGGVTIHSPRSLAETLFGM